MAPVLWETQVWPCLEVTRTLIENIRGQTNLQLLCVV